MADPTIPESDLVLTASQRASSDELRWVDSFTRTLDTRLKIPGTNIRFGLDFILGLIPGLGDFISLGLSGLLIATMAKNGASLLLVTKMLGNVLLDAIVGSVPILGNVFDLFYKANTRNLILMREYYQEDKHRGSAWPILITVFVILAVVLVLGLWILIGVGSWLWKWFSQNA
jgi:Domain of unknown function (DUF4112)